MSTVSRTHLSTARKAMSQSKIKQINSHANNTYARQFRVMMPAI